MRCERHPSATNKLALVLHWLLCTVGLIVAPASIRAANVPNPCVTTVEQLHQAFELAGSGDEFDAINGDIRIVAGTYAINNNYFQYGSSKTKTLDISGGWNTGCTKQVEDPRLTIISGVGSSKQLFVSNSAGDVSIRFITFKAGRTTSGGSALQMNTAGDTGPVILDNDIFTNNSGGDSVVDVGAASFFQVDNNLFYANGAATATIRAGNPDISGTIAKFEAVNNTMTQNAVASATSQTGQIVLTLKDSSSRGTICNNIFQGNDPAHNGFYAGGTGGKVDLISNMFQYATPSGGVTIHPLNNITAIDPEFVNATNFHLSPLSPGINSGATTPPNGAPLPELDIAGYPRKSNNHVDMGAYENEFIFADGFEARR